MQSRDIWPRLNLGLKPTFRHSKLRNKYLDHTIEVELTNRPEEVADRSSGTGIFTDDKLITGPMLASSEVPPYIPDQRLKDGHATGYTDSYGINKIAREAEQ